MEYSPDRSLQIRMAVTLLAILVANLILVGFLVVFFVGIETVISAALKGKTRVEANISFKIIKDSLVDGMQSPLPLLAVVFIGVEIFLGLKISTPGKRLLSSAEEDQELTEKVKRMAINADITPPKVLLLESDVENSFTFGRSSDPTVVVTTGLLDKLDEDELEGVLAHEIAHIKNRDLTVTTVSASVVYVSYRWFVNALTYGIVGGFIVFFISQVVGSLLSNTVSAVTGIPVHWVVAPFMFISSVAFLLGFAICVLTLPFLLLRPLPRSFASYRELAADRGAAQITGEPMALASALKKLHGEDKNKVPGKDLREEWSRARFLCIAPTKTSEDSEDESKKEDGFDAIGFAIGDPHPSVEHRVRKLERMVK